MSCFPGYGGKVQCECQPGFLPIDPFNTAKGCDLPEVPSISLCEPGPCGPNADCFISEFGEDCKCKIGYNGDPLIGCNKPLTPPSDPCYPSPCGRNTICKPAGSQALCSCIAGYLGDPTSPKGCRPECVVQKDCPNHLACISLKCLDPCPGSCGINAICRVENHNPICNCPGDLVGDPFVQCQP